MGRFGGKYFSLETPPGIEARMAACVAVGGVPTGVLVLEVEPEEEDEVRVRLAPCLRVNNNNNK